MVPFLTMCVYIEAIRKDLGRTPNETFVVRSGSHVNPYIDIEYIFPKQVEIVGVLNDVIEAVKNVKKWARVNYLHFI